MSLFDRLEQQARQAQLSRHSLIGQVTATRDRLAPKRLKADAIHAVKTGATGARDDMIAHARAHPFAVATGVTLITAWVLRKPLLAHAPTAIRTVYGWLSGNLPFIKNRDNDAEEAGETDGHMIETDGEYDNDNSDQTMVAQDEDEGL